MAQNQSQKITSGSDAIKPPPHSEVTMADQINQSRARKNSAEATANRQVNQELNQPLRSVPPPPPPTTPTPDENTQANAINLGQSKEKSKKSAVADVAKDIEKDLVEKQAKKTIVRILLNPGTWVAIFWIIVGLAIAFLLSVGGLIIVADYQCMQQKGLLSKGVAIVNEYRDPGSLLRDWAAGKCIADAPAPTADAPVKPETPATTPAPAEAK